MPTVTINGNSADFDEETRLVNAIRSLGVNIGHRCGGKARCTTCRIDFIEGEPEAMTEAEHDKLKEKELLGKARLSCQILCSGDMEVKAMMTKESEGWPDTGPDPADVIEPEPVWR